MLTRAIDGVAGLSRLVNAMGMVMLVAMMLLTTVDVVGRYVFNSPILGGNEITEFMQVSVVFLGVAYTAVKKGHVAVDLVVKRLPQRAQGFLASIVGLISVGLFALIAWQSGVQSLAYKAAAKQTLLLQVPVWPFVWLVTLGSGLLCLVLLGDFLNCVLRGARNQRESWLRALAAVVVTLLLSAVIVWSEQLPKVSPVSAGIVGMGVLFLLLLSRMPVGFVLALVGFMGASYLRGLGPVLTQVGRLPYVVPADYNWSVVTLFVFMGFLAFASGLGRDLYHVVYKWLGYLPGGLAVATVGACAGFAAACGDSLATAITMGTVALPEMKKYKYDPSLATGCVAAGGTLGVLIPPSIILIIYAMLTNQSVGQLFIAAILPGILLCGSFMLSIYVRCRLNPKLGPPGPRTTVAEKLASLKGSWGIILLFGIVMGGIYFGVFTPTEAGGIGAFGALIVGLSRRGFTRQNFIDSLLDSGKLIAMCFIILTGAAIFSLFLALSRLPMELADFTVGLPVPRLAILIVIFVIYILLGCVMPGIPLIILTLPIFYPVVMSLGYDPIWFGVIIVLTNEMAVITPPVGINVFGIAGIAKDIPIGTIFRGIFPFLLVLFLILAILTAFPQIATFLPSIMRKG